MKLDTLGCVVRERYPEGHIANLGDSCAESARAVILGDTRPSTFCFQFSLGYLRHPNLIGVEGWGHEDFSNDQFLPLIMAYIIRNGEAPKPSLFIKGTRTLVSVGVLALMLRQYWLLNAANVMQGGLLSLKWRIADGGSLERSEGQVQDWLNYICTYIFLKRISRWATLNQSVDKCMKAVRKYYLEGEDAEPNAEWIVELYEEALRP